MSDLMLLGVLRMPLPDDPAEVDPLMWLGVKGRIQEAATRIERDADEIDHLRAYLREERDRVAHMRVEWAEEVGDLLKKIADLEKPVDMILHCPACLEQHIDRDEGQHIAPHESPILWRNPPHRSHLCHHCGFIWRPSDRATNGVEETETKGRDDMVLIDGPQEVMRQIRIRDQSQPRLDWDGDRP